MIAALANTLWLASCAPELTRFHRATKRVKEEQEAILRRLLRENAESEFGRQHGFTKIRSIAEYRERVQLREYEDYEPWIERIAAGESNVLTCEPVRLLEPTGGSSGATKLIPYTASLQREFHRGIRAWVADLMLHDPALLGGRAYWSVSPVAREAKTAGGIPIGFESDAAYLGGWHQRLLERAVMAVPSSVRHITDVGAFREATRSALLDARDLRLISVWNPSLLTLLLEDLSHDRWPNLRLISCWTDANAAGPAAHLQSLFPNVRMQGKGLIATEGFVSFPLTEGMSEGNALAIRSHFLEFLPIDSEDSSQLAHELERGQQYSVVLSTGGGLFRYRLNDVVEVTGRIHDCPTIRFIGRQSVSDWFGEKLHEAFVAGVLRTTFDALAIAPRFATVAFEPDLARYVLYIEAPEEPSELAERVDAELRASFHYDYARRLGQLGTLRVVRVANAAERLLMAATREGRRAGDVKPLALQSCTANVHAALRTNA